MKPDKFIFHKEKADDEELLLPGSNTTELIISVWYTDRIYWAREVLEY